MSKNDEAIDPRIRRTKKMLLDSLISLILEKGFAAVTVKDIADRAMVNRATFYNHYEDKFDLLERGIEGVLEGLRDADAFPSPDTRTAMREGPPQDLVALFRHVAENELFYRAMLGPKGVREFADKLKGSSEIIIRERIEALASRSGKEATVPIEVVVQYATASYTGIVAWWVEHRMPYPPEEIAQHYVRLNIMGLYGAIGL